MAAAALSPALFTGNNLRLADRIKIQCQRIREKDYVIIGRLTAVHWEGQRDTRGLSQSRPRYGHPDQPKMLADAVARGEITSRRADALKPFSEKQNILWQSLTLDWLSEKKGPIIARSRDQKDWLLPEGLTRLPDMPDPRFTPAHVFEKCPKGAKGCSGCIAPRIPQRLTGCPIVGDRVQHKITSRDGYVMGILHPIKELSVVAWAPDGTAHFVRVRAGWDQSDSTYPAMLLDDDNRAFFVGGTFS